MLKELKKQSIGKGLKSVFMFLFISIVLIALGFGDFMDLRRGAVDFNDLQASDLSEDICIKLSLTDNYGAYMEEEGRQGSSIVKKTTALCYLIGIGDPTKEDFRYVSLVVPPEYRKQMEDMAQNTYMGKSSEPVEFMCEVKKMGSQDYSYANYYLQLLGYDSYEAREMLCPYHIVYRDWEAKTKLAYVFCGSGAGFGAIAILLLFYTLSGARVKKIQKEVQKLGYTWEYVEVDFEKAKVLVDNPAFRVGRMFTFLYQGATPHIILNKNIVWGYYYSITEHGKAGLKKTTHMVGIRTVDKKGFVAEVPGEGRAKYILDMMNKMLPWMVIGSDDAFHKMFDKDFKNFLDIRYNQFDDKTTNIIP